MFHTLKSVRPITPAEQSSYDRWMDQTFDRQQARNDRLHGAEGIIPLPVWVVLFLISGLIFAYVLFFADSAERAITQGMLMGSVSVVVTLLMLLLIFFNHPLETGWARCSPPQWNGLWPSSRPRSRWQG